ncbi:MULTISPECIES: HNH endonuclease family protein [Streptomyces]|uniref:HNH endonuclease family protein n=1 Tax=Streptomyces TaxID=1883 RepID=UPI0019A582ED|nr:MULTISPECIES: HNH endonuclease family protein [Streptomyces]GGR59734.1 hypothetical protein GCM10010236_10590 [Streptomyces eurythermus]
MRFARTAALATALTALLVPATATAHAAPTTDTAGRAAGRAVTLPVRDVLAALPVRDQDRTGYERTAFRHWVDADKDGCNTRAEVLKAVTGPEEGPRCTLTGGEWYSPYDDRYIQGPRGLDIDHLVPLAEAWDSGASAWSSAEREAYTNDLGDERALIAVSDAGVASRPGGGGAADGCWRRWWISVEVRCVTGAAQHLHGPGGVRRAGAVWVRAPAARERR